jgi:hypothetical protein
MSMSIAPQYDPLWPACNRNLVEASDFGGSFDTVYLQANYTDVVIPSG